MLPFIYYHSEEFAVPSFALSIMLASLVPTVIAYLMAKRRGLSQVVILDLALFGTILGLVGGRMFHVVVEEWDYYWETPSNIYRVWMGGWVSYGAFIGVAIAWLAYLRIRKLDTWRYLDYACVFAVPFNILFVRLGCLLAGCCYGKPSPFDNFEYILHMVFHQSVIEDGAGNLLRVAGDAAIDFNGVRLWPTQIWAITYSMILFGIAYWTERRAKFKGQVAMTVLMSYAVFRSILEFFRGDTARGVYLNDSISTAQIVSIIVFLLSLITYFILKKKFPLAKPYPIVSISKEVPTSSETSKEK